VKNYGFTFDFGHAWGNCQVVMTCVSGHLTEAKFPEEYERDWSFPPPESLFGAPVNVEVVGVSLSWHSMNISLTHFRKECQFRIT
jgi:hypothetical protein